MPFTFKQKQVITMMYWKEDIDKNFKDRKRLERLFEAYLGKVIMEEVKRGENTIDGALEELDLGTLTSMRKAMEKAFPNYV